MGPTVYPNVSGLPRTHQRATENNAVIGNSLPMPSHTRPASTGSRTRWGTGTVDTSDTLVLKPLTTLASISARKNDATKSKDRPSQVAEQTDADGAPPNHPYSFPPRRAACYLATPPPHPIGQLRSDIEESYYLPAQTPPKNRTHLTRAITARRTSDVEPRCFTSRPRVVRSPISAPAPSHVPRVAATPPRRLTRSVTNAAQPSTVQEITHEPDNFRTSDPEPGCFTSRPRVVRSPISASAPSHVPRVAATPPRRLTRSVTNAAQPSTAQDEVPDLLQVSDDEEEEEDDRDEVPELAQVSDDEEEGRQRTGSKCDHIPTRRACSAPPHLGQASNGRTVLYGGRFSNRYRQ